MHKVKVNSTRTGSNSVITLLEERISNWTRVKRIIWIILKCKQILKQNPSPVLNARTISTNGIIDVDLLEKASVEIIKMLQRREFVEKFKITKKAHKRYLNIKDQITVTKSNPICGLDVFLDDNGVLKVGG